jgi:anthranilate synthase component 1
MTPSLKEFLRLTRHGNVIPVYKEISADLDTPVSAFLKIRKDPYGFLLESVEGQEKIARYSFLGSNPSLVITSRGTKITLTRPHQRTRETFQAATTPFDEIRKIMAGFKPVQVEGLPRFSGGLIGYIGYDMVRFFERIPDSNPDQLGCPDMFLMLTDTMLVFDHIQHTIKIVTNCILPQGRAPGTSAKKALYIGALRTIEALEAKLRSRISYAPVETSGRTGERTLRSNQTKKEFTDAVRSAKRYIRKGDIIQVVVSQRFCIRLRKDPFSVYRTLRGANPSPYMFYLTGDEVKLIGASPEMLVRCENGVVVTRPIAGTRPRGETPEEDVRLMRELSNDPKERAEHVMLVDLGRNDIGRVSRPGSVGVSEFMSIEKYSHVMHLVSEVRGILDKKKADIYDVLTAAFPAGTVSGSPKIRAMEIIDELEPSRRGPYAGCVGYFSFSGNTDTCITIRTIVVRGNNAYIQAGAGIVADSVPEKEYQESVHKARALIEAVLR